MQANAIYLELERMGERALSSWQLLHTCPSDCLLPLALLLLTGFQAWVRGSYYGQAQLHK